MNEHRCDNPNPFESFCCICGDRMPSEDKNIELGRGAYDGCLRCGWGEREPAAPVQFCVYCGFELEEPLERTQVVQCPACKVLTLLDHLDTAGSCRWCTVDLMRVGGKWIAIQEPPEPPPSG